MPVYLKGPYDRLEWSRRLGRGPTPVRAEAMRPTEPLAFQNSPQGAARILQTRPETREYQFLAQMLHLPILDASPSHVIYSSLWIGVGPESPELENIR